MLALHHICTQLASSSDLHWLVEYMYFWQAAKSLTLCIMDILTVLFCLFTD